MLGTLRRWVVGEKRDVTDPEIFHHVSLAVFLAWVGLGADGLSSSAYGPDEAFRALGPHTHMAILLVLMTAVTIFVISIAYSNLIQHFPGGGGGYLVATKLLGPNAGVVSGCALLVDYVLTISVSIASGCDAFWSFLPLSMHPYKLAFEIAALCFLIVLNLRGVKESVTFLMPIFMLFVVTHVFMIVYAIGSRVTGLPAVFSGAAHEFHASVSILGFAPVMFILLRAYSMGGGTYTGIEAVSNGVGMLREPRVKTGQKTMMLMATSLAFTAGGILFGYLLTNAAPVEGQTMNAVLLDKLFGTWNMGGFGIGRALVIVTLISETALLMVAAQTGFLDGPRVLANMAVDSWMPHGFAQLSDRLVTKNGIYIMGVAAIGTLLYTGGNITTLVVMYSINVFITFSLTELGMARHWILERAREPKWKSQLAIHGTGLIMCLNILLVTLYEKFAEGGWVTTVCTGALIAFCFWLRSHYRMVHTGLKQLDEVLGSLPAPDMPEGANQNMNRQAPTAVLTVANFSGFGMHHILSIQRLFPNYFKNFIFVSVGVVDSGNFKGAEEISKLDQQTRANLEKYVDWCRRHGLDADYRMAIDTEAVKRVTEICHKIAREFPRAIFFTGKLIFKEESWYQKFLHNDTANAIQRELQFDGLQTIILPIRAQTTKTA
jgi:amino acid transporter